MGKRNQYNRDVLLHAQQRRQAILDFLNAHPRSSFDDIMAVLPAGNDAMHVRGSVGNMLERHEIAATGQPRDRIYIALVSTTHSADDVLQAMRERKRADYKRHAARRIAARKRAKGKAQRVDPKSADKPLPHNMNKPGHYIHKPGSTKLGNQGGQGAIRARVTINCAQFY